MRLTALAFTAVATTLGTVADADPDCTWFDRRFRKSGWTKECPTGLECELERVKTVGWRGWRGRKYHGKCRVPECKTDLHCPVGRCVPGLPMPRSRFGRAEFRAPACHTCGPEALWHDSACFKVEKPYCPWPEFPEVDDYHCFTGKCVHRNSDTCRYGAETYDNDRNHKNHYGWYHFMIKTTKGDLYLTQCGPPRLAYPCWKLNAKQAWRVIPGRKEGTYWIETTHKNRYANFHYGIDNHQIPISQSDHVPRLTPAMLQLNGAATHGTRGNYRMYWGKEQVRIRNFVGQSLWRGDKINDTTYNSSFTQSYKNVHFTKATPPS